MAGLNLDELREQLKWFSGSVSNSVRTTAFGVIAAIWAIYNAEGIVVSETFIFGFSVVRLAFIAAAGALFADILQYVASYWMTSICFDKVEEAQSDGSDSQWFYNQECLGVWGFILYRTGSLLFLAKLALAISSALFFFVFAFGVNTGT